MPDSTPSAAPAAAAIDLSAYRIFTPPDPFEDHVGPIYFRQSGDTTRAGAIHCVLPTAGNLMNAGGVIHGGAIMTFADYALCLVSGRAADRGTNDSFAMTVTLTVEFLEAGRLGPALEATGEPLRVTSTLAFARGEVTQEGRTLAAWSGTCRHISRAKVMARKAGAAAAPAAAAPDGPWTAPDGYQKAFRASPFMHHTGQSWFRRDEPDGRIHVVQPTQPHMANSGGNTHGGMLMTFADNALCTAITATTGKAPATATFSAEFIAGGEIGAPLESLVELPKIGRNLAFARGTVVQGGRPLLSYNALVALRDWAPGTGPDATRS